MKSVSPSKRSAADTLLADLVDQITRRLQAGETIDLEAYAERYPQCAAQLRELGPTLELLHDLRSGAEPMRPPSNADEEPATPGELGDFRLLREIGRGGMGVVYEAEQISLQRRVALKVLPFAAVLKPTQLQRFKNEALAAATLDHPNIVRVFSVGCERGVHFYAMQLIEGQTLGELIRELRRRGEESSEFRVRSSEGKAAEVGGQRSAAGIRRRFLLLPLPWRERVGVRVKGGPSRVPLLSVNCQPARSPDSPH